MRSIDLNCDVGEGYPTDAALMPFISSANIACGYHAGDLECIERTISLCIENNVAIGAHPGFADKKNFGRTEQYLPADRLEDLVMHQVLAVRFNALQQNKPLHHVKLHGAMYNMAARDKTMAAAIATAVHRVDPTIIVYGLSGSYMITEAKALGLKVCNEVFADRTYQPDGSLTPRTQPNALINSTEACIKQVLQMIENQTVTAVDGTVIPIAAESVCLHGDGEHAVDFAKAIHKHLTAKTIEIKTC